MTYTLTVQDSLSYKNPYYRADIELEVLTHVAQPPRHQWIEVQLADGQTAFYIANGEILEV